MYPSAFYFEFVSYPQSETPLYTHMRKQKLIILIQYYCHLDIFSIMSDNVSYCLQVFFSSAKGGSSCQIYFMTLNKPGMANWWLPQLRHNHTATRTVRSRTESRNTLELVSQSSYSRSTLLLVPWYVKHCWGTGS
jgi:hypothetical protein